MSKSNNSSGSSADKGASDVGAGFGGLFEQSGLGGSGDGKTPGSGGRGGGTGSGAGVSSGQGSIGLPASGVTRAAAGASSRVFGKGPVSVDARKFRYDVTRARVGAAYTFGASRADRMDAIEAGDLLHRLHQVFAIEAEPENRIAGFDKALFWEHTINGASLLQPGRGVLSVGESRFDLAVVKSMLGPEQRRFFRAFADDIADVNRQVLAEYDPYDPESIEKHGQLMQVAVERGLQKYPYLAHDSSDAGVRLSIEERMALMASKRVVLGSTINKADKIQERVAGDAAPLEDGRH